MKAGSLRHLVTIEKPSRSQNGYGETVIAWSDAATVWAAIYPVSANESLKEGQVTHEITHEVRMRHTPEAKPDRRIRFGSRTFEIKSVLNLGERGIELKLLCQEQDVPAEGA